MSLRYFGIKMDDKGYLFSMFVSIGTRVLHAFQKLQVYMDHRDQNGNIEDHIQMSVFEHWVDKGFL